VSQFVYSANSEEDTERLGKVLAQLLPDGTVVALEGTLGAGKTRLTQALAVACGVPRETVLSPTFVLCHHYTGERSLHHLDAYRINDDDEFLELGVEEFFESDGITLIEWADRVAACLPEDHLQLKIEVIGENSREFCLIGHGRLAAIVPKIAAELS
jgi:tRNA threonylcarbamoyladenosine biosynthesis protein TsaE